MGTICRVLCLRDSFILDECGGAQLEREGISDLIRFQVRDDATERTNARMIIDRRYYGGRTGWNFQFTHVILIRRHWDYMRQ